MHFGCAALRARRMEAPRRHAADDNLCQLSQFNKFTYAQRTRAIPRRVRDARVVCVSLYVYVCCVCVFVCVVCLCVCL